MHRSPACAHSFADRLRHHTKATYKDDHIRVPKRVRTLIGAQIGRMWRSFTYEELLGHTPLDLHDGRRRVHRERLGRQVSDLSKGSARRAGARATSAWAEGSAATTKPGDDRVKHNEEVASSSDGGDAVARYPPAQLTTSGVEERRKPTDARGETQAAIQGRAKDSLFIALRCAATVERVRRAHVRRFAFGGGERTRCGGGSHRLDSRADVTDVSVHKHLFGQNARRHAGENSTDRNKAPLLERTGSAP